jgi:hypothetical protein
MEKVFSSYSSHEGLVSKIFKKLKNLNTKQQVIQINSELNTVVIRKAQMANKYTRKCSTSLAIKEIQIKTTQIPPHSSQNGGHQDMLASMWGERGEEILIHCW